MPCNDFFGGDGHAQDVLAYFAGGKKLMTKAPARGETQYSYFEGTRPGTAVITTVRAVVHRARLPAGSKP